MPLKTKCKLCDEIYKTTDTLGKLSCNCCFHYDCIVFSKHLTNRCPACNWDLNNTRFVKITPVPKEDMVQSGNNYDNLQKRLDESQKIVETVRKANAQLELSSINMEEIKKLRQEFVESNNLLKTPLEQCLKNSNGLQERLNESENIIETLRKENAQLKLSSINMEEKQKLRHEFKQSNDSLKIQLEQILTNINNLEERLNESEKTNDTLRYNANSKNMEAIQKLQQECEQNNNLLTKLNIQLESNSQHSIEQQKNLNESEQVAEELKKVNDQLVLNSSEQQKLKHECVLHFGYFKQIHTLLQQRFQESHEKYEQVAENTMILKTLLKTVTENMEKILTAQQQSINEAENQNIIRKESIPNAAADNINLDSTQHKHQDLPNAFEEDSIRNSVTNGKSCLYEPIDDSSIENAVALKNQVIQDLEQELAEKNSALEQEKENSKQLTVQRNKLQKCLSDLVKEQQKVLLAHINTAEIATGGIADTLLDESENQQEVVFDDDFENIESQICTIALNPK